MYSLSGFVVFRWLLVGFAGVLEVLVSHGPSRQAANHTDLSLHPHALVQYDRTTWPLVSGRLLQEGGVLVTESQAESVLFFCSQ